MKIPTLAWNQLLPRLLEQLAALRTLRLSSPQLANPRRWLRRLGWPGMAAGALLAGLGAFYFSAILPAEERLEAAREDTASLFERIRQAGPSLQDRRRPPAEQLVEFYRLLPRQQDLPEQLEKIFAVAEAQGLSLDQGEYKTVRKPGSRMLRYQITLPLKGAYPQVRKFLADLPKEVPTVALKAIQFERQKVGDPVVEAQVKLVLFLEQES